MSLLDVSDEQDVILLLTYIQIPGFQPVRPKVPRFRGVCSLEPRHVDTMLGLKRIAFGQSYGNHPRYAPDNVLKPDIACGSNTVPAQIRAEARAGSELVFGHSTWPVTHLGPVITYLGPYSGDLNAVNITDIEFFKIAELGLSPDGQTWATQVLTANDNVTSATIPHDIKPGSYVVRHEIITLHFATENSRYMDSASKTKGAQVGLL